MTARRPIATEALLRWAVQTKRADLAHAGASRVGPQAYGNGVSADGVYATMAQGQLGVRVDCVGSHHWAHLAPIDPDAEAVYQAAHELAPPRRFLVLSHARCGTRPDWRPRLRPVEIRPDLVRRHGVLTGRIHYTKPDKPHLQYCRFEYRQRWGEMQTARELYRDWWCALRDLTERLQNGLVLDAFTVTEIGAPEFPWAKKP